MGGILHVLEDREMRKCKAGKVLLGCVAVAAAAELVAVDAGAAVFDPGSIILFRAGDGNAPATGQLHAAVSIQEYSQGGSLLDSVSMPTGPNGFTIDRTATSDGILQFSADGRYLMFGGYSNAAGDGQSGLSFGSGTLRM